MSDYDASELIAICESILEDGELSGEELYGLADWLNNHRDACFNWPGEILVHPLQNIWADGKITKTELRLISRLLLRIRKEWAKRQAQEAVQRAVEIVAQIAMNCDLRNASTPTIPLTLRVKSYSEKGVLYDVDLSGPVCSCPDWRANRKDLPSGHLTRCCKHVFDAYGQIEPASGWPGWLGAFFDLAWTPHPHQNWKVLQMGRSLVLVSTAPNGWANVFVEEGGAYDRFGYNVLENRWSYGIAPTGSRGIAQAITELT